MIHVLYKHQAESYEIAEAQLVFFFEPSEISIWYDPKYGYNIFLGCGDY